MHGKGAALRDRAWALCAAGAVICAVPAYALLVTTDVSPPLAALLTTIFGFGFALGGIALHLGVTGDASPRVSLLAAVANTAAAVELIAMALVQIAVTTVEPHPGRPMVAIWLGLDVAWDVFGAVGTLLLGFALWGHRRFRLLALTGIVAAALLLALNLATFPIPPAEAGWVDVGPLVALWYVALCVRLLLVARGQVAVGPAAAPAGASAAAGPEEVLAGMAAGQGDG